MEACPGLETPAAPGNLALTVTQTLPSTRNNGLGIRNDIDFGAESTRPTPLLSTLLSRRSPDERQDSLPAYPLRLWPDWTFTSWTLSKGFIYSC